MQEVFKKIESEDIVLIFQRFEPQLSYKVLPPFGNDNPNGSKLSKLAPIKNLISPYKNSRNLQSSHILSIFMGPWHPFQKSI